MLCNRTVHTISILILIFALLTTVPMCVAAGDSSPQDGSPGIQRDRFLLLDNRIVERTKNAKLYSFSFLP